MKKVGFLSCINEFQSAYSIATMTYAKLKAMNLLGIDNNMAYIKPESGDVPKFCNMEIRSFKEFIPLKDWYNDESADVDSDFLNQLSVITPSFIDAIKDLDVLIVDDILLQGWYLPYLMAIRVAEKSNPNVKVYFNNHSCPSKRKLLPPFKDELLRITDNEYILYNNYSDIPEEERMYNAYGKVFAIFNPIDIPKFLRVPEAIEDFYYAYKLYTKDIITTYPVRLDAGKQIDKWLTMLSSFKKYNTPVFGIIVDSYGTGKKECEYREKLKKLAEFLGLVYYDDYVFTSEVIDGCEVYTPYDYTSSLMALSNLFMLTSFSETYSLITLEAMASKQYVLLNEDLRYVNTNEFGSFCHKAKFCSTVYSTEYIPNFNRYCLDKAKEILLGIRNNQSIKGFIFANRFLNLVNYGKRLLSIIGMEVKNDRLDSVILSDTGIVLQDNPNIQLIQNKKNGIIPISKFD